VKSVDSGGRLSATCLKKQADVVGQGLYIIMQLIGKTEQRLGRLRLETRDLLDASPPVVWITLSQASDFT